MLQALKLSWLIFSFVWRSQAVRLLTAAAIVTSVIIALTFVVFFIPSILSGPTHNSLRVAAKMLFGRDVGATGLALAFLIVQGPLLLGILLSFFMAGNLATRMTHESARGRFELMLAGPYRAGQLALALFLAGFYETVAFYVVSEALVLGLGLAVANVLGNSLNLPNDYWSYALFAPLGLTIWAGFFALILSLAAPELAGKRFGGGSSFVQLLASLPGFSLLLYITLKPTVDSHKLFLFALSLGALALVLAVPLLDRLLRKKPFLS